MANLIKGALIKQISKYLKNVTPNQINISTLKGEGEMKNIQLDENVLMDLLELPTWLRITNAKCNKANVKIPWTKLKTSPIIISLDKIEIDMEITESLREYSNSKPTSLIPDKESAYNFIDRCIDAMQLNIDSITITIKSEKFNANLNMSNIFVYSCGPDWRPKSDITFTKLKDVEKDEIILFKEISWETCRLEASMQDAVSLDPQQQQTSIKLIMNPSKIQIALKKRLADKSLVSSTFRVLLNEIYWMANDIQLKAAIGTYQMIAKLMKKSFEQKRKFVAAAELNAASKTAAGGLNALGTKTLTEVSKVFQQYDIKETSLHLNISVLNVHLYADDNYSGNKLIDGGAMQILFKGLCFDHYPYHRPGLNTIKYWNNYNYTFDQREEWSKMLVNEFIAKLEDVIDKANLTSLSKVKFKTNLNLMESASVLTLNDFCIYKVTTNMSNSLNKTTTTNKMKAAKKAAPEEAEKMADTGQDQAQSHDHLHLLRNELLKKKEFFLEQQTYNKRSFLSSNYSEFNLPGDTLFAQLFFSEFYFPNSSSGTAADECNYPLPSPQLYAQFSPLLVNIDYLTLLWVNTLLLSIYREKILIEKSMKNQQRVKRQLTTTAEPESPSEMVHCDSFIEFIMPKVNLNIFNSVNDIAEKHGLDTASSESTEHPCAIEIGLARFFLTNQSVTKPPEFVINADFHQSSSSDFNLNLTVNEDGGKRAGKSAAAAAAPKISMAFANQAKKNFKHLYDSWSVASKASSALIEKNSLKLAPIPLKSKSSSIAKESAPNEESLLTRSEVKPPSSKDGGSRLAVPVTERARSATTTPTLKSKTPFTRHHTKRAESKYLRFKQLAPCFKQVLTDENCPYARSGVLARHYRKMAAAATEDDMAFSSSSGLVLKMLDKASLSKSASKDLWQIELENLWVDLILPKPPQPASADPQLKSRSASSISLSSLTMPLVKNSSFKFWAANVHDFYHDKKIQLYEKLSGQSLFDSNSGGDSSNGFRQKMLNLSTKIIQIDDDGASGDFKKPFEIHSRTRPRSNSMAVAETEHDEEERRSQLVPLAKCYSKLNVIGYIDQLSVECNHSQINFLLRLIDTVDLFTKQLELDSKQTLKHGSNILAAKKQEQLKKDAAILTETVDAAGGVEDDVSVNFFVRVNQIDVDLVVNEIRKEVETKHYVPKEPYQVAPNGAKAPLKKTKDADDLDESGSVVSKSTTDTGIDCSTLGNTTLSAGLAAASSKNKAAAALASSSGSATPSMTDEELRKDFVLMAYSNEREFLSQYLLFTYGLSTVNPHTTLITPAATGSTRAATTKNTAVPAVSFSNKSNTSPTSSVVEMMSAQKPAGKPPVPPPPADRKGSISSNVSNYGDLDLSSANFLADDGIDNYSLILKEQEDETSSQMSFSSFETVSKSASGATGAATSSQQQITSTKNEILALSASQTSLNRPAAQETPPDSQNLSPTSVSSSSETRIVVKANSHAQTQSHSRKVNIRLAGLNVYMDSSKEQAIACALISVESLKLENSKMKPLGKKKMTNDGGEQTLLVRFRKMMPPDAEAEEDIEGLDHETKNDSTGDLVELLIENARLSLNIPTLTALAELIEDDKDTFEFLTKYKRDQTSRSSSEDDWNDQESVDSDDDDDQDDHLENDQRTTEAMEREVVLPIDMTLRNFKLNLYQTDLDKNNGNKEFRKKALSLFINKKLRVNKLNSKETKIVVQGGNNEDSSDHSELFASTTYLNELKILNDDHDDAIDPFQLSLPTMVKIGAAASTSKSLFSLTKPSSSQSEMQLFKRPDTVLSSAASADYASLIYQLRRAREENKQLLQKTKEQQEKLARKNAEERDKYEALIRQLKSENEKLKQQQAQQT